MSEARNKFYELLNPLIDPYGYRYKKSKYCYVKSIGQSIGCIEFIWDGRGGFTSLTNFSLKIYLDDVNKSLKKIIPTDHIAVYIQHTKGGYFDNRIPNFYSKAFNDLINTMNFKKMSAMPFDDFAHELVT